MKHKFAEAIKANAKKPVTSTLPTLEDLEYQKALDMLGLTTVKKLRLDELDNVFCFYKQAYRKGKISKSVFIGICEEMLGLGIDWVLKETKHGSDILFVADGGEVND